MKFKYILSALIPYIMASCKKEDVLLFNSEVSGIYFQTGNRISSSSNVEQYWDSTAFSFSVAPMTTMDTILTRSARVRTMGKVRDYPRPVKVSIDQANSTAVEGKHFEIDLDSVVIPAGASEVYIPVKFKRTADLLNNSFSFVLKLEDNEHFMVYIKTQRNYNSYSRTGALINADKFKFIVSEKYVMPSLWQFSYFKFFGPWTVTKFKYINFVLGKTPNDWMGNIQTTHMDVLAILVRKALQALADAGTPMLDEDGLGMQLGANYQVRY